MSTSQALYLAADIQQLFKHHGIDVTVTIIPYPEGDPDGPFDILIRHNYESKEDYTNE